MHGIQGPHLLVLLYGLGGIRSQFPGQLCYKTFPLSVCLWLPASCGYSPTVVGLCRGWPEGTYYKLYIKKGFCRFLLGFFVT